MSKKEDAIHIFCECTLFYPPYKYFAGYFFQIISEILSKLFDYFQPSFRSFDTSHLDTSFAPKDAYRLLDINLRQRYYDKELIEESLYLANVLKVNDEEFNVLRDLFGLNGTEREVALWFIEKYGLRMFVLTAGSSHSTIYTREEISTLPTPEVTVADTVGAGDAFSGALIISLLKGKSLSEAHHFAVKTAAFVCTKEGAWPVYEE